MVMAAVRSCPVYERRQARHGRYPFHQDLLPRRCDPPHAGADRGAAGAPRRALRLAGGGGLRAAGAPASGGRRGHPGRLAALAQVALCAGDARRDRRAACAPSARGATTRSSTARACCAPPSSPAWRAGAATATTARSIREPLAVAVLRRAPPRQPRPARGRAQPHPERPGARLRAAGRARFRARPRALCRAPAERYAVLLHATARPDKQWPEENWIALGKALAARRARSGAALGQRGRARAQRAHRRGACRARACRSARRSMRWRG